MGMPAEEQLADACTQAKLESQIGPPYSRSASTEAVGKPSPTLAPMASPRAFDFSFIGCIRCQKSFPDASLPASSADENSVSTLGDQHLNSLEPRIRSSDGGNVGAADDGRGGVENAPAPAPYRCPPCVVSDETTRQCELLSAAVRDERLTALQYLQPLLTKLRQHPSAKPFLHPVDPIRLRVPDYYRRVKAPMDLDLVKLRLTKGFYARADELAADVDRIWENACAFNPSTSIVHRFALECRAFWAGQLEQTVSAHVASLLLAQSAGGGGGGGGGGGVRKRKTQAEAGVGGLSRDGKAEQAKGSNAAPPSVLQPFKASKRTVAQCGSVERGHEAMGTQTPGRGALSQAQHAHRRPLHFAKGGWAEQQQQQAQHGALAHSGAAAPHRSAAADTLSLSLGLIHSASQQNALEAHSTPQALTPFSASGAGGRIRKAKVRWEPAEIPVPVAAADRKRTFQQQQQQHSPGVGADGRPAAGGGGGGLLPPQVRKQRRSGGGTRCAVQAQPHQFGIGGTHATKPLADGRASWVGRIDVHAASAADSMRTPGGGGARHGGYGYGSLEVCYPSPGARHLDCLSPGGRHLESFTTPAADAMPVDATPTILYDVAAALPEINVGDDLEGVAGDLSDLLDDSEMPLDVPALESLLEIEI